MLMGGHRCPFCNGRISSDAHTCPRCGRDLPYDAADPDGDEQLIDGLVGALVRAKRIAAASSVEESRDITSRLRK